MNAIDTFDQYVYELCMEDKVVTSEVAHMLIDLSQNICDEAYEIGKTYKILKVVKADE